MKNILFFVLFSTFTFVFHDGLNGQIQVNTQENLFAHQRNRNYEYWESDSEEEGEEEDRERGRRRGHKNHFNLNMDYFEDVEYFEIDLKARASDLVETFNLLKNDFPNAKIYAIIDGQSLSNIVEMEVAKNETLMRICYRSGKKVRVKTVKIEQIEELSHW